MKHEERSDGGRFWAVQNGLAARLTCDEPEGLAALVADASTAVAEGLKETRELTKQVKDTATKITQIHSTWETDHKAIEALVKAGGVTPEVQKRLEEAVQSVFDRHQSEMASRGIVSRQVTAAQKRVTDPWDAKGDYLAWAMKHGEESDPRKVLHAYLQGAPATDTQRAVQRQSLDMQIVHALAYVQAQKEQVNVWDILTRDCPNIVAKWREYQRAGLADMGIDTKAALDPTDTATAGNAGNWIPTPMAAEVRERIMLESRLPAAFERIIIRQAGKTWDIPVDLTDVLPDLIPETTAYTNPYAAADPTQLGQALNAAKKQLVFAKVRGRLMWSGEFDEAAIIDAMPFMRNKLFRTHRNGEEQMIVNGQKTATIDTGGGGPGTYDIRKGVDGLRYFASAGVANVLHNAGSDNVAYSDFTAIRALMGEYGTVPDDLLIIPGPAVYLQLLNVAELKTRDVYGDQAANVQGEIARLQGMPVVPSRYVPENLNASGIYDAVTQTQTACIVVNRRTVLIGEKRELTFEAVRLPQVDQWDLISMRSLDVALYLGSTQKSCGVIYNIDTAVA